MLAPTDGTASGHEGCKLYAAGLLKDAKPMDLPVKATRFELVINLNTARELRLDVPPMLLALAAEVVD